MKLFFAIGTVLFLTCVEAKGNLLGRNDGHEPNGHSPIGGHDGHDLPGSKPIGGHDGHDLPGSKLIGGDGHDFGHIPSIGKDDGHEPTEKHLIGEHDGHESTRRHLIGEDDGHESTRRHLIGEDDGHERVTSSLIGRPDGHEWNIEMLDDNFNDEMNLENKGPLVRCKRPICDEALSCHIGPQIDSNGCVICKCLEDPCLEEKCETGYLCSPIRCPVNAPCKKLETQCKKKKCSGPEPMCADYCPLGYELNDKGCMTCICRDQSNLHNLTAEGLSEDDDMDLDDEDYEMEVDEEDPLIVEDLEDDLIEYDHHDETSSDNEDESEEGEMCEKTRCRKNEVCKSDWRYPGDAADEKTNMICIVKTRCWAMTNERDLYLGYIFDQNLSCDSGLAFEPLQCSGTSPHAEGQPKVCWCITDLGEMIDGTKTYIYAEEQKPICERNNTVSATIVMKFKIAAPGTRKDTIVNVLTKEISEITHAPHGAIKVISVDYPGVPLTYEADNIVAVTFILSNNPDYDLPYALDLLFKVTSLTLNFDLYKVRQSGKTKVTHYQFTFPPPPALGTEDDSDLLDRPDMPLPDSVYERPHVKDVKLASGYLFDRSFVIACLTVLSILIVIVLSIIVVLARRNFNRNHIRHHQLQVNVAVDPEPFMSDPLKNESVVLITDDVLSKVDSSLA